MMATGLLAAAPAFAAEECWIDAKTGLAVSTLSWPRGAEWPGLGGDFTHGYNKHTGQNFVLVPCPPTSSHVSLVRTLAVPPSTPRQYPVQDMMQGAGPNSFYAGVLGGPDLAGTVTFTSPDNLSIGGAFGVFGGMNTGFPGVSVEANLLHTSRAFTKYPADAISTTSFMLDGKYTVPLTGPISLYGGVGLGGFGVSEDYSSGGTGVGIGYNLMVGANMQFTPTITGTLQVRHEGSFGPIHASNGFDVSVDNTALLVGAQFALPPLAPPPPP